MAQDYLTITELRAALDDATNSHTADYQRAITAASRKIDEWCSGAALPRYFYRDAGATPRLFTPTRRRLLRVGDFAETADVVVRTDEDGDGSFETVWASSDWQAEPLVRPEGHPFTALAAVGERVFPLYHAHQGAARVQVTARWGWAAVPAEVNQACLILAVVYYKAKDLTGRDLGSEELTTGVGPIALAEQLVAHLHLDEHPGARSPTAAGGG